MYFFEIRFDFLLNQYSIIFINLRDTISDSQLIDRTEPIKLYLSSFRSKLFRHKANDNGIFSLFVVVHK